MKIKLSLKSRVIEKAMKSFKGLWFIDSYRGRRIFESSINRYNKHNINYIDLDKPNIGCMHIKVWDSTLYHRFDQICVVENGQFELEI